MAMEHFAYFCEISKGRFLGADSNDLWWSHDEFLLFTSRHVGVLVTHYLEGTVQQFVIGVISIRTDPYYRIFINYRQKYIKNNSKNTTLIKTKYFHLFQEPFQLKGSMLK